MLGLCILADDDLEETSAPSLCMLVLDITALKMRGSIFKLANSMSNTSDTSFYPHSTIVLCSIIPRFVRTKLIEDITGPLRLQ